MLCEHCKERPATGQVESGHPEENNRMVNLCEDCLKTQTVVVCQWCDDRIATITVDFPEQIKEHRVVNSPVFTIDTVRGYFCEQCFKESGLKATAVRTR